MDALTVQLVVGLSAPICMGRELGRGCSVR